jgi:hypothetical protein
MAVYEDPPTFAVATVTVPQLNRLSEDIRYLKEQSDLATRTLRVDVSPGVGTVGTGEDPLMSYQVPGGVLGVTGDTLEIVAAGAFAANANNKRLYLYWGATSITLLNDSPSGLNWSVAAYVSRLATGGQRVVATLQVGTGALFKVTLNSCSEDLAMPVDVKFAGLGTVDDDVTQALLVVRLVPSA